MKRSSGVELPSRLLFVTSHFLPVWLGPMQGGGRGESDGALVVRWLYHNSVAQTQYEGGMLLAPISRSGLYRADRQASRR